MARVRGRHLLSLDRWKVQRSLLEAHLRLVDVICAPKSAKREDLVVTEEAVGDNLAEPSTRIRQGVDRTNIPIVKANSN